jgi:hypothetical protein
MTEHEAIQLATHYQAERHRTVKVSGVRWIDQEKMAAFAEWLKTEGPSERPDWLRPVPHWVILFEHGLNMAPHEFAISVYNDGTVFETPAM